MPSQEDRATATGNMHKNLVKFGRAVFVFCERTDRQTDKHTHTHNGHTHHNTSHPSRGEVTIGKQLGTGTLQNALRATNEIGSNNESGNKDTEYHWTDGHVSATTTTTKRKRNEDYSRAE